MRTAIWEGGLEPDFCLALAFSCPVHCKTAPLLAHCLAVRPLPPVHAIEVKPKPPENGKNCLLTPSASLAESGCNK